MKDQPVAEAATYTTHNKHKRRTTSMPSVGFEPRIPVVERLQTYALDRTATGIGADPITAYNKETNVHNCTFELGAVARRDACRHIPNKTSFESRTDEHYFMQSVVLLHSFRLQCLKIRHCVLPRFRTITFVLITSKYGR
jgi:hypothetical protein